MKKKSVVTYKSYFGFSILLFLCIESSVSVFEVNSWSKFLKDYVSTKRFDAVNILLSEESDLSVKDRKVLWSSLDIPLSAVVVNDSKKLDQVLLRSSSLSVVFAKTAKNLQLLDIASEKNLLRYYKWIVIGNPKDIAKNKKAPYLALDNLVVFAQESSTPLLGSNQSLVITLKDVYQASPYLTYIIHTFGYWNQNEGLKISEENIAYTRTNLTGLHLRCTTLPQPPFIYISESSPGEEVQLLKGYLKDVWDSLQEAFRFSYTCHTPGDNEWGTFRNGKWTGLIKDIKERTADVIVAPVDFTGQRSTAIQYLIGIRTVGYNMIIRRPGLMSSTWTSFTSELHIGSWLTTFSMLLLAPLCLWLVTKYSPYEDWKVNYNDACILALGALTIQGSWINVTSLSSRVVFITIFLGNLLIYAHYTSALVAQLTIASDIPPYFSSFENFLQNGRYGLGFKKGIALEDDFRSSKTFPYKDVWENVISPVIQHLPVTDEEGIWRVIEDNFVYMMEENMFKFGFSTRCEVMLLHQSYFTSTTSIAFALDSPYAKAFNNHLTKLRVSGALDRFWKRWQPTGSQCTAAPFVALSIDQTFTAFLVLLLGLILSILVCLPIEKYFELSGRMHEVRKIPLKTFNDLKTDNYGFPLKTFNGSERLKHSYLTFPGGTKRFR